MWAGFAARGRSRLNCRKLNWTAPVKLTAVQPSPWLYRESIAPLGTKPETKEREKGPPQYEAEEEATKENNPHTKRIQWGKKGGGEKLPHLGRILSHCK